MNKRFCTTCQQKKPESGGYKQPGLSRGWRCEDCMNRRSVSPYLSQKSKQQNQTILPPADN